MSTRVESTMSPSREDSRPTRGRFEPGHVIGDRYRVVGSLRPGRLDEAYQVDDIVRGERVALRVLCRSNRRISPSSSLARQCRRLARLRHPNVARVHELAVHVEAGSGDDGESVLFVTSELVEGETLGSFVRKERPSEGDLRRELIDGLCSGLTAVHRKRVVHGDLSSAAIILSGKDGSLRPVITDFSFPIDENRTDLVNIGSPVYKAPETIVGQPPDTMSDVFSLGAIIYEVLSGRIPFTGGNLLALDFRQLEEEARPLRELVEDLDPTLDRVVSRCLSRGPEDRYRDASEVLRAIKGADFWTPRTRRNVTTLSAAAALVAVMLGGSALLNRVTEMESRRTVLEVSGYRPSFAILDFAPLGGETEAWIGVALSELMRDDFSRDGSIRVADDGLVREHSGLTSPPVGLPDGELAGRIRTLFDVEAIVVGTCSTDLDAGVTSVALDLCVVDARSGETLAAAFERGSPDSLPELVARTASRLRASIGITELEPPSISWDPDAVRPWATGLALLRQYQTRSALEALEKARDVQPANPRIHDSLQMAWSQFGAVRHATDSARRAVELSRLDEAERRLAREATLAMLEGDTPRAIERRGRLSRAFPDRVSHTYTLIDTLLVAGATRPAAEEIRRLRMARATVDPRTEIADARLNLQVGRLGAAATHAKRGAAIAAMSGSTSLRAEALIDLAWVEAAMGDPASALETLRDADMALDGIVDPSGLARVDSIRAGILQSQGDLDAALVVHERLGRWYGATGQEQGYATALGAQASVLSLLGRHEDARGMLEEAIARFRELEDDANLVRSLAASGVELFALGRLAEARVRFAAVVETAGRRNQRAWEGYGHVGLARVAIEDLDLHEAESQLSQASSIFGTISLGGQTAGHDLVRSDLDRLRGRLSEAEIRLTGLATGERDGLDRERQAELHLSLSTIALASGRNDVAAALAGRSVEHYASVGNVDRQAECLTVALVAATRLRDESTMALLEDALRQVEPRIESPLLQLRLRLARAQSLDAPRARTERLAVHTQSSERGLGLIRLEAAYDLLQGAPDPAEHDRWQAVVERMARKQGASLFLDPR